MVEPDKALSSVHATGATAQHERARGFPDANSLRTFVLTVIDDARAPLAIRNECHRLMIAIGKNDQILVDETLASLRHVTERVGYALPSRMRRIDESKG